MLDLTIGEELCTALVNAVRLGEQDSRDNQPRRTAKQVRETLRVGRWRGGNDTRFSAHLNAVYTAYKAAHENLECSKSEKGNSNDNQ